MSKIINNVWIDRIATQYLSYDKLEEVNLITKINPEHEVNFCDWSEFEEYPELKKYTSPEKLKILQDKVIDYIMFRLD